jgi:hypothetical protein
MPTERDSKGLRTLVALAGCLVLIVAAACASGGAEFATTRKLGDAISRAGLGCLDYGSESTNEHGMVARCTVSDQLVSLTTYTDANTDVLLKVPAATICPPSNSWIQGRDKTWFVTPFKDAQAATELASALGAEVKSC